MTDMTTDVLSNDIKLNLTGDIDSVIQRLISIKELYQARGYSNIRLSTHALDNLKYPMHTHYLVKLKADRPMTETEQKFVNLQNTYSDYIENEKDNEV